MLTFRNPNFEPQSGAFSSSRWTGQLVLESPSGLAFVNHAPNILRHATGGVFRDETGATITGSTVVEDMARFSLAAYGQNLAISSQVESDNADFPSWMIVATTFAGLTGAGIDLKDVALRQAHIASGDRLRAYSRNGQPAPAENTSARKLDRSLAAKFNYVLKEYIQALYPSVVEVPPVRHSQPELPLAA